MTKKTLSTHVQTAQEALRTLLKTLAGTELPLETADPERASSARGLGEDATARFALHDAEQGVVVVLAPAWVPLLSEGMLGQALEADAPDAADLMQEIAAQGFGTVQTALAAEGLALEAPSFVAVAPGQETPLPDGAVWHVPFAAVHEEGMKLDGFVLWPAEAEETAAAEEAPPRRAASPEQAGPTAPAPDAEPVQRISKEQPETVDIAPAAFADLGAEDLSGDGGGPGNFELLAEVDLEVTVELGRRRLPLADVLKLTTGSVVELEKLVGEPLSVYANGRLIAEGEAVVIDEQFGVRITNLASKSRRDKAFF